MSNRSKNRLLLAILALPFSAPAATGAPPLADVLAKSAFSAADQGAILGGKTVVLPLAEAGDRELAVGTACLTNRSLDGALAAFLGPKPILPEDYLLDSGTFEGEPSPDLFREIALEPDQAAEVARFLKARPGTELNLSEEEIAAFTAIERSRAADANIARVHQLLARSLSDRYAAYRSRGLDGIADYARAKGGKASPAEELRASTRAAGLALLTPGFERAWLSYPENVPSDAAETWFWAHAEVMGRPAITLAHRLFVAEAGLQVVGQRSFYVSRFFDSGESLVAVGTVAEGNLVLYQDRLWLDELSGLSARLKKSLGRRFLETHVDQTIQALQICAN